MRVILGMLGGAICALVVGGFPAAASGDPLVALILCAALGALFGGLFTSVMCGRIATGSTLGIGLVYGVGVYPIVRFAVLPNLSPQIAPPIDAVALLGLSLLFGALMGVWVIAASHIWPRLSIRCQ